MSLSFTKSQVAVIGTVGVLAVLTCIYFFIYVPHNDKALQEQRFDALHIIDKNVHEKLDNSTSLITQLVNNYSDTGAKKREKLTRYIKQYSTANFSLLPLQTYPKQYKTDTLPKMSVDANQWLVTLNFFKRLPDSSLVNAAMQFSFSQFFTQLLPENIFDEYLVFHDQQLVYETFPAGISKVVMDSLLGVSKTFTAAGSKTYIVGGVNYRFFLQPVKISDGKEWVIAGLMKNDNYENKKRALPPQVVVLLITLVFCLILSLPWLKLYNMGSKDRLTVMDGVASILVAMLLTSVLFFFFFHYNTHFRDTNSNDASEKLALSIDTALNDEADTAYAVVRCIDSILKEQQKPDSAKKDTSWKRDVIYMDSMKIGYADNTDTIPQANELYRLTKKLKTNQIFWLNSKGDEFINWTADSINSPHGKYSERTYFKKLIDGKGYLYNNDADKPFYLEQVTSWTSFTFRNVISIPSKLSVKDSPAIACLSFTMSNLDKTVLPTGYQFAVIDDAGKVLYHTYKSRNLVENLCAKFSDSKDLQKCIAAHCKESFVTSYYDKEYNATIHPLKQLPYYAIVLEDEAYKQERISQNYGFTFSMLGVFLLFMILQLFGIFIVSSRRTFFKKQFFDTGWIGPRISCKDEYITGLLMNIIIIAMILFSFPFTSFLTRLFTLLFAVTYVPFFFNYLLFLKYKQQNKQGVTYKVKTLWSLGGLMALVNIAAYGMLDESNFLVLFLIEGIFFGVGFTVTFYSKKIVKAMPLIINRLSGIRLPLKKSIKKQEKVSHGRQNDYIIIFSVFILTRLLISSGLPLVFFYVSSFNYEESLHLRSRQLDFANRLLEKYPVSRFKDVISNGSAKAVYKDGKVVSNFEVIPKSGEKIDDLSKEKQNTMELFNVFRIELSGRTGNDEKFYQPSVDSSFYFTDLLNGQCTNKGDTAKLHRLLPGTKDELVISSACPDYKLPSFFPNGCIFWFLFFISLCGFHVGIYIIIKKLFALNLPDISVWKNLDKEIIIDQDLNERLFIIGVPGAGKKKYIMQLLEQGEIKLKDQSIARFEATDDKPANAIVAEMINIPTSNHEAEGVKAWKKYTANVFQPANKLIVVNNFEYNMKDPVCNFYKLEFLERLYLNNKDCKIIILSTIHPIVFLDSMDELQKPGPNNTAGHDLERWHVLLGHYRIIILSINENYLLDKVGKTDYEKEKLASLAEKMSLEKNDFFKKKTVTETNPVFYLKDMQPAIFATSIPLNNEVKSQKFDEMAFKLQVTAHYFYMYIWQSLTREEKFLLYDLAEDNLVNSFDDYNLGMLISKGIIVNRDGSLKIFNKGFRNFIMTAIGNVEAMQIKKQIKENGNWNSMKYPLQITILGILVFLFSSQQEMFAKLVTYAAALGAGIPAILKLFSLFGKSSTPKQE